MRDLRAYARQTNRRLILGFILLIFLVGDGLIYLGYGWAAALSGLACIAAGLLPLFLIWLVLEIIDGIVRKANEQ
ncbi:MAG: hypothetical protein HYZ26_10800 [Chloroflexi bacterium]|nr:hypothetical protein [Chloroflexota bacterium]